MIDENQIRHHAILVAQLRDVKNQEMMLRREIQSNILGSNINGTARKMIGNLEVTVSVGESISVKTEDLLAIQHDLTDQEKEVIIWKPSLNKKIYDILPGDSELRKIVTLKLSAPKVTVDGL